MSLIALIATIGAGIGLSAGLAFNLRLAAVLGSPLIATLVTFFVGAALLLGLWTLGVDSARPDAWPPLWTLLGGVLGVTYVTLSLITGARLGAGASTVAVTLGQVLGASVITGLGWLGQTAQPPTLAGLLSAALLLGAVALLAADRGRKQP
ncbi:DMT family transporter [Deinococcus arenicola]|uniref:DMT family transporter n=1 Tax=Deinococcus arenicola TaxID=2994950 RepID=A0ABU4DS06_9DEIO|nr:DMT family transporter [Deinococcus sp. ZS9-10]MDV6375221.1 DMT family transporter [Deinococcus sp. ZS9-10]